MKQILIIIVFLGLGFWFFTEEEVRHGPGVVAADDPIQTRPISAKSFDFKGYTIKPLASFEIKARVLSRKDYSFGREAELSPLDFALGWGNMSDETILDQIKIWQSGRWYRWQVKQFPIPRREIETHSANMHMLPANERIEYLLKKVKKGDIIELKGHLVKVEADDGWRWKSSLTRKDTGNGACEVIWVEDFMIL